MYNHVAVQGRLVRDPELRKTQSDVSVANFAIAVDRDFKDRETGERQADFFDVVVWRGTADFVANFFHKGDPAVVSGRLQNNRYTDKDGNNRVRVEILAENVYFGSSKRESSGGESGGSVRKPEQGQNTGGQTQMGGYANNEGFAELTEEDGDLPF